VSERDASAAGFAIRGVIEGFYGNPWTEQQRMDMVASLGEWGMNMFVYSPKDDPFLRSRWAEPFDDDSRQRLQRLIQKSESSGMTLAVALSPGLSMKYSDETDRHALVAKLRSLRELGVDSLGLFLDDIPDSLQWPEDRAAFPSLAAAHADLINLVAHEVLSDAGESLMVCPTVYWGDCDQEYLVDLCKTLDPRVNLMWTGKSICSATLDQTDAQAFFSVTGRKPLFWDNYPVNDVAMKHELHLGPYERRDPNLRESSLGIIANAMEFAEASKIPLFTIAEFLSSPHDYGAQDSWNRAIECIVGVEEDVEAFTAFAENSRSSCLSLSDAVPLTEALWALQFSLVSNQPGPGIDALVAITERYEKASEHLSSAAFRNAPLAREIAPWAETFKLGAVLLRQITTLAMDGQLDTPRVLELEAHVARLRSTGKRVFGDSLEMAVSDFLSGANPSPSHKQ